MSDSSRVPGDTPRERMATLGVGTRVVVRYRVPGGATDALGPVIALDPDTCTVDTRRGPAVIRYADMIAAKSVPPPPQRRPRVNDSAPGGPTA